MKKSFDVLEVFHFSWKMFTKYPLLLIALTLLASTLFGFLSFLQTAQHYPPLFVIIISVLSLLFSFFFHLCLYTVSLSLAKEAPPTWRSFGNGLKKLLPFAGCQILYFLIVSVGLLLFIIPGIIWFLQFLLFPYFIIEQGKGPLEALKESRRITRGYKGKIFVFCLLALLLDILGALFFGIGLFITLPLTWVAQARIYVLLTRRCSYDGSQPELS